MLQMREYRSTHVCRDNCICMRIFTRPCKCLTHRTRHPVCIVLCAFVCMGGGELVISTWPSLICFPFNWRAPRVEPHSSHHVCVCVCWRCLCVRGWDGRSGRDVINLWSMKFNQTIRVERSFCWRRSAQECWWWKSVCDPGTAGVFEQWITFDTIKSRKQVRTLRCKFNFLTEFEKGMKCINRN